VTSESLKRQISHLRSSLTTIEETLRLTRNPYARATIAESIVEARRQIRELEEELCLMQRTG